MQSISEGNKINKTCAMTSSYYLDFDFPRLTFLT